MSRVLSDELLTTTMIRSGISVCRASECRVSASAGGRARRYFDAEAAGVRVVGHRPGSASASIDAWRGGRVPLQGDRGLAGGERDSYLDRAAVAH